MENEIEAGQVYQYKGKTKSFPKEVKVIEHDDGLLLEATKESPKYIETDSMGNESEYRSPVGELHALFVITSHAEDWKLKK